MPTTSNFGWTTPADTDLVKDGAAAIRTLGNGVDASLVDLKGGTTGQVLSKATNTDLDYTWITPNVGDITEVQAGTGISVASGTGPIPVITNTATTTIDAEGDLLVGDAADALQRLAIGSNGNVLTVDTAVDGKIKWAAPAAGGVNKNYLINGGFAIAQRGTSFTASANNDDAYTLDRWYILSDTNDVIDVTQDTSTVPTNGQFAIALDVETVNKKFGIATIIENKDCVGLIGNTVTFSFKAKVSATTKLDNVKAAIVAWSGTADTVTSDIISAWNVEGTNPTLIANATYENSPVNLNLTTSYASYSVSAAVDTASTKNIILFIWSDVTDTTLGDFLYIAESKLELGSTATAFEYAGGTLEGELAACQRYYYLVVSNDSRGLIALGTYDGATVVSAPIKLAVTMRTDPSLSITTGSNYYVFRANASDDTFDSLLLMGEVTTNTAGVYTTSGVSGTGGHAGNLYTNNASASLAFSAEL
jgi:hypothetical protein